MRRACTRRRVGGAAQRPSRRCAAAAGGTELVCVAAAGFSGAASVFAAVAPLLQPYWPAAGFLSAESPRPSRLCILRQRGLALRD